MIAARIALALHPATWRAAHEHEVMSTLLDLADDNGGRIPAGEVTLLAWQGAWMRARTSAAFWGGILIIALMLWAQSRQFYGFVTERYWNEVLTVSAGGLLIVLPIAGALAAWNSASAGSARARLRRSLPILLATLFSYLVTVVVVISASGWPPTASINPAIPAAIVAFAATAVGVGVIAGGVLPRWWAAGVTLVVLGIWYLGAWTNYDIALRNLTGTNILLFPADINHDVPQQALVSVLLTAIGVVAVAGVLTATRNRRGRLVTVLGAVLAAAVVMVASVASPALIESWSVPRDSAQLVCTGSSPSICLWPEEQAVNGASQRQLISSAAATAAALGVPVPEVLSSGSSDDNLGSVTRVDSDGILTSTAAALVVPWRDDAGDVDDVLTVTYALALLFGADSVAALPGMGVVSRETAVEHRLTPDEVQDRLGVHDATEARAVVDKWLAGELSGLRAP